MRRHVRKYVLILLVLFTALLCTAGASTWILLGEKTVGAPQPFEAITTTINTDNLNASKIYVGNESSSTITGLKVMAGDVDVTTFFEPSYDYSAIYTATGTATELKGNVTVSFKAKTLIYSAPASTTVQVPLEPVAYCGSVYYSTIDTAIDKTTSGTITVIPTRDYTTETTTAKRAKTITKNAEIKSGVTLSLPYTTTTVVDYYYSSNNYGTDYIKGIAKDTSYSETNNDVKTYRYPSVERSTSAYRNNPTKYLKNNITIASGKTLTNNGAIKVGGVVSGGNGGQALNSYTIVDYAQITLQASAKLQSNGTITNYGFIVSDEAYSGTQKPQLLLDSGSLTTLFNLVEHRGGTIFAGVFFEGGGTNSGAVSKPKGLPFNRFYMENVAVETKISSSSQVISEVNLWATSILGASNNESSFLLIGNTSDAFIQLEAGSYIISHFSSTEVKDYLDFYGDFAINNMSLSVLDRNISSSNSHFPISNHYAITLNKLPTSNKNAKVTFHQKIKIMQGGSLTVNQGVDLTANEIIVYTTNCFVKTSAAAAGYLYPTELADGKLIVNGSLTTSKNIGGLIQTTVAGASLNLTGSNSTTAYELVNGTVNSKVLPSDGEATFLPVSKTLSLPLTSGSTTSTTGTYYSKKLSTGAYAWAIPASLTIQYAEFNNNSVKGDVVRSDQFVGYPYSLTDSDLSDPTIPAHYTFDGWYFDSSFTNKADVGDSVDMTSATTTITLYPKFTPISYTISYAYTGLTGVTYPSLPNTLPTSFTIESEEFSLPNDILWENSNYTFTGWYFDSACTTGIDGALSFDTLMSYYANGQISIYGEWTAVVYYVSLDTGTQYSDITFSTITTSNLHWNPTADNTIQSTITKYDDKFEKTHYFGGWYVDAAFTTPYDPEIGLDIENGETRTLYAKWIEKNVLTFDVNKAEAGNANPTEIASVYLLSDQLYTLPTFDETNKTTSITKYNSGWTIASGTGTISNGAISIASHTTLKATWTDKFVLTFKTDTNRGNLPAFSFDPVYLLANQEYDLTATNGSLDDYDNNVLYDRYFNGWTVLSTATLTGTKIKVSATTEITVNWANKLTISITSITASTVTSIKVNGVEQDKTLTTLYIVSGDSFSIKAESNSGASFLDRRTIKITFSGGVEDSDKEDAWPSGKPSLELSAENITSSFNVAIISS